MMHEGEKEGAFQRERERERLRGRERHTQTEREREREKERVCKTSDSGPSILGTSGYET